MRHSLSGRWEPVAEDCTTTVTLPRVATDCAQCADPNRRSLDGLLLPPVFEPHGHCSACGKPIFAGYARDSTRACSACFRQAIGMMVGSYSKAKGGKP